jgi:hypothetical protein
MEDGDRLIVFAHLGCPPVAYPLQQPRQAGVGGCLDAQQEARPEPTRLDFAALAGPAVRLGDRLPEPLRPRRAEHHTHHALHPDQANQRSTNGSPDVSSFGGKTTGCRPSAPPQPRSRRAKHAARSAPPQQPILTGMGQSNGLAQDPLSLYTCPAQAARTAQQPIRRSMRAHDVGPPLLRGRGGVDSAARSYSCDREMR